MELFWSFSISNIMSKTINIEELAEVIRNVDGLESNQRAALLELLKKKKKYGIVWWQCLNKPDEPTGHMAINNTTPAHQELLR